METFNELTVFCSYKYLWPHLPCMERAVSQRGHLEGSKSTKVLPTVRPWKAKKVASCRISTFCIAALSAMEQ